MKIKPYIAPAAALAVATVAVFSWHPRSETTVDPLAQLPSPDPVAARGEAPALFPFTDPERVSQEDSRLFDTIEALEKHATISLPLPGGGHVAARVNHVSVHPNGATEAVGELADGSGIFTIGKEPDGYRGFILRKEGMMGHVFSGTGDAGVEVATRPAGEIICMPEDGLAKMMEPQADAEMLEAAISNSGRTVGVSNTPIPILSSLPSARATIYLDLDGEVVEGQTWRGGKRWVARSYNMSASAATSFWQRVAEDFAPFQVNVTTDLQAYLRAPQGLRMKCIVTRDNFTAEGHGGVAYVGSFTSSGEQCCWVFMSGNSGAMAASHEIGHTLGLGHDGTSSKGYSGGYGSGATSWGPIMGAPYSRSVTQWSKGSYPGANQKQDDMAIIGLTLGCRDRDHGSSTELATPLKIGAAGAVQQPGVIESRDDIDTFIFTTGGGSLNLQVNGAPNGQNLDIEAKLYNAAGTLVTTANPSTQVDATLTATLAAGTYTLTIDGTGYATWETTGYDDYGSLGQYTITGTVPSPGWRFSAASNSLAGTVLGNVAPGAGTSYSIIAGNTGSTFAIHATTGVLTVANAAPLATATSYALTVRYMSGGSPVDISVPVSIHKARGVKREIYTGLGGSGVAGLTASPNFPNSPASVQYAASLAPGRYAADHFGQRLSSYLVAPETGDYTFWVAADDASELWLSTDANPANKVKIAFSGAVGFQNWTSSPDQQSVVKSLVAGQKYYIEVLHRDLTGRDHVGVAWQTPSLARQPVSSSYLEHPDTPANMAPWLANMSYRVLENSPAGTVVGTLAAGDVEPGSVLSAFTITGGNTGNAFAVNSTTGVLTVNGALSFAGIHQYKLDVSVTDSGGLTTTAQVAVNVTSLGLKREVWTGVTGTTVASLTALPAYPGSPGQVTYIPELETPVNAATNYGQKISGQVRAPDTGTYRFWVAANDTAQVFLSTDSNPANKVKIAFTDGPTNVEEWDRYSSQKSAEISLEGGKFYYVEVLHKQEGGNDHLSVSWSGPGFSQMILGGSHVTQETYNHGAPVLNDATFSIYDRDANVGKVEAKDWADAGTTVTYSITGGNSDGAFEIDALTGVITRTDVPVAGGPRVLTVTATDNGPVPQSDTGAITVNVTRAAVKREVWTNLPLDGSGAIEALTSAVKFQQPPDGTSFMSQMQSPSNVSDRYGQRLSSHLVAPVTGSYTFWIASNDGGALYLSTDENPANKRKIAGVTTPVGPLAWTTQPGQQSVAIDLVAGNRYYIEALQYEATGNDHVAVAWQGPGFARQLIPSTALDFPESFRPALRREVWNSAGSPTLVRSLIGGLEWGSGIHAETFAGIGALSGSTTDDGVTTWGASAGWALNAGVATKTGSSDALAALPFVPEAGHVYTLSLEIDPTNSPGSDRWFSLGFLTQPATTSSLYTGSSVFQAQGRAWLLARANGSSGGNTFQAFSSGTGDVISASPAISAVGSYDTVAVVLDTRPANWVSSYYHKSVLMGSHTHGTTPVIQSVGFFAYNSAVGNVRNFRLTASAAAPTAGSATAAGMVLAAEAPASIGDAFSQRLSGYLIPPSTGSYTFWVAGDESSDLLLSTDDTPANAVSIARSSVAVASRAWTTHASQQSTVKTLEAGKRYYIEVRQTDVAGSDHVAVAWQGPGFTRRVIGNGYLEPAGTPVDRTLPKLDIWTGIAGSTVADLTSIATYPGQPDSTGQLVAGSGLAVPVNAANSYGQRVTGYIVPPDDGRYTFWISSDNTSEFWLSTDDNPTNKRRIAWLDDYVPYLSWDTYASQKSLPIRLAAGKRYFFEAIHKENVSNDFMTVAWEGPALSRRVIANHHLEHPWVIPSKPSLKREVWTGITGSSVSALTSALAYEEGLPSARGILTSFEAPRSWGDNYGQKVSGYLVAPVTGDYKFWVASDDTSELWLSTSAAPEDKVMIATVPSSTLVRDWTRFPAQESAIIPLVAGERYYIEALHKEGPGNDHLSVAWEGPSIAPQVIDGRFLEYPGELPGPAALKSEMWTDVTGSSVTSLTALPAYPDSPDLTRRVGEFSDLPGQGADYGQKLSGYLIPPVSGDFTFWIASDDSSEFRLSTDASPANLVLTASVSGATGVEEWTKYPGQTSVVKTLVAGERYYLEVLHKNGSGADHVELGWEGPGFMREVIPGACLEYPGGPAPLGDFFLWSGRMGLVGPDLDPLVDPDGDGIPNGVEFVIGGKPSGPDADSTNLLPTFASHGDRVEFVFRRTAESRAIEPFVEYSTSLGAAGEWAPAVHGHAGVTIEVVENGAEQGVDLVRVRIPKSGDRMFLRLNSNVK